MAPLEGIVVQGGLFHQLNEHQHGQLVEGVCIGCMVLHGQVDAVAGPDQPVSLGLVATPTGSQDQLETLFRCKGLVVLDQRWGFHLSLSFRESSTASSACVRLLRSSTTRAPNRASASVAVRRDFSPVGKSAASSCRNRTASIRTTSNRTTCNRLANTNRAPMSGAKEEDKGLASGLGMGLSMSQKPVHRLKASGTNIHKVRPDFHLGLDRK